MDRFTDRLSRQVLVLDGAMGTMIMKRNLDEAAFRGSRFADHPTPLRGCNDALNVSAPAIIADIHRQYLEAGADIILTNTFNSNRFSLVDYQLSDCVAEIAGAGARLARRVVDDFCTGRSIDDDRRPFVAGSMGPTGVSLSIALQGDRAGACDFDMMADAYCQQAMALVEGGVDLLLLETIFDTLNAKAASFGIAEAFDRLGRSVPLMLSATLTEQGRLLSGQTIDEFVVAMAHSGALSVGLNCGFGAQALLPRLEQLAQTAGIFVSVHPNAGLPDAMGRYLDTPATMQAEVREILDRRLVNIVGGCCGTTPDHIRLIAEEAHRAVPRVPQPHGQATAPNSFAKVGERCNVAGSRKFLRLVSEGNWSECVDLAAGQLDKGVAMIDINMDDAMLHASDSMACFIGALGADSRTSSARLMIDSSDFGVVERALRILPLRGVVNSISLKNGEEEFIDHARLIRRLGCEVVVMAFDERGQADTLERRIEICRRAYRLLTERAGVPPTDIIFDPNVLAVATGIADHNRYALDFLEATAWIKGNLPGARVSGGVSNLSFSFRGIDPVRKAMHSIFLEHAIARGMDMAIVNPATPLTSEWVDSELHTLIDDVLLCRCDDATDRLVAYATDLRAKLDAQKAARSSKASAAASAPAPEAAQQSACDLLAAKLLKGENTALEPLLERALAECGGSAMKVVDSALMAGMDRVGELFGSGRLFLPQVVRSAAVMKHAVEILTPVIEAEQRDKSAAGNSQANSRQRIVLATVKGDVHDIGKNIVSIVLRCSGYDVIDLGVMTPPELIISTAVERQASAIGLSGLITPSLHEMGVVASMMEERGLTIPLFIGGATTSLLHTAVKIAPEYSGAVVRTGDAASLPGALSVFTGDETSAQATGRLKAEQAELRNGYEASSSAAVSLERARECGCPVNSPAPAPVAPGRHLLDVSVAEAAPLINWRAFLAEWGLNPAEARNPAPGSEAARILADAMGLVDEFSTSVMRAEVVILPGRRVADDTVEVDGGRLMLPAIRSLIPNPVSGVCPAMSDFVASENDHIGFFAVTVAGSEIAAAIGRCRESDEYRSLLLQSLSHRLVEAATEWMHTRVRRNLWGLPADCGIRPAVGYSSLPDQSLVFLLDELLNYSTLGIELTSHGALSPSATTTGLIIGHPQSRYFDVGPLTEPQRADYARRRGIDLNSLMPFLK